MRLRCRRRAGGREAGSATLYVVAMVMILMCLAGAALSLSAVVTARHRAAAAADLAALAAASVLAEGEGKACSRAAQVALAHGAEVARCSTAGTADAGQLNRLPGPAGLPAADVPSERSGSVDLPLGTADVTVELELPGWLRRLGHASARARAG